MIEITIKYPDGKTVPIFCESVRIVSHCEPIDVTQGGLFGVTDPLRRFVPGPVETRITAYNVDVTRSTRIGEKL